MNEDQIIWFQPFYFSSHFNGFDNDELTKIKITKLPSNGTLQLSGNLVSIDQEVFLSDLDKLTFTPQENFFGLTNYSWNGNNGTFYS